MQKATISLLFKKGDDTNLAYWRPISLLNVDYKILTKILNAKIAPTLTKILSPDQKGFVPTRKLDDAILKATHLMHFCKHHNIPAHLMLLDQEKAFDRVDRKFMHKVIHKFGFPENIQNWIKSIYHTT